jgi:broad specificity phosphatase PhoE
LRDVHVRCLTFLLDLVGQTSEGDVAVVAHEGSIRMLRAIVANVELAQIEWKSDRIAGVQQVRLPSKSIQSARAC